MVVQNKGAAVKNINFFNRLAEPELAEVASLCMNMNLEPGSFVR